MVERLVASPPAAVELAEINERLEIRKRDGFVAKPLLADVYASDFLDVASSVDCLRSFLDEVRADRTPIC